MDELPLIDRLPVKADDIVALSRHGHADRDGDLGCDWWAIVRDSYEGTGGFMASVRAATTGMSQPGDYESGGSLGGRRRTYLTAFTRESGDAFTRRADRSAYENHIAPVVDIYLGHMDRRPPQRTAPEDVVAWWRDIDGEGHMVDGWMSAQRLRAQLVGWRAVLVDRPLDPDATSATGETVARALEPEEIRDWQVGADGALDWIRLASEWHERDAAGGTDVKVIELSTWTRAEWARVRMEERDGQWSVVERVGGEHPCGRVPVAVLRWQETLTPRALYGLSQVQGVVPLVLRLFNTLSEYDHHLANANFATLVINSDSPGIFSELKLGTTNGIRYEGGMAAPSFIAPPSDVAVQYALRAEQLVRAIYTAAKVQRPGGEAQSGDAASGVAMAYEFAQTDAALQGFARRCAAFELELVSLYDAWKGADGATRAATTVVYPTRFDARGIQDDLTAFFAVLDEKVRSQFPPAVWREARLRIAALVLPEASDAVRAEIDAGIGAMFAADTASTATAAIVDDIDAAINGLPADDTAPAASAA